MPRLEIPVRTSLRFMKATVPVLPAWHQPESVVIEFEGREFGWVARDRFPHQAEDEPPPGPMVTCLLKEDSEEEWDRAAEMLQRLLSALAFHYNTRIESRNTKTGSGQRTLLDPHGTVEPNDAYGGQCVTAPARVDLDKDKALRVALGLYREALAAGSPFYRFLALWNVLDARFDGDESARDNFLRANATGRNAVPNAAGADVAKYLREDSRHAIAHIIRRSPQATSIDPDMPSDRERLELDAYLMRDLTRVAILDRWPAAVSVESVDGLTSRSA